jgi:hypothetical protein
MTALVNGVKCALIDTPIDFASYLVEDFSSSKLEKSKNLLDKVGLILTSINFANAFGYSGDALKKVADQCKSFKNVYTAVNFIPSTVEEASKIGNVNPSQNIYNNRLYGLAMNVVKFVKNFFSSLVTFLNVVDKFSLGIGSAVIGRLTSVGNVAGGVGSVMDLNESVNKLSQAVARPTCRERTLKILAATYGLVQKIALVALSAITLMTTVFAPVVAAPVAVPAFVVPALAMTSTVSGLFSKYVESRI